MLKFLKPVNIITGHYGSGKTNIAVNLALLAAKTNKSVTVIDLDIVNPYFRTADFSQLFAENGIRIVSPLYANTNLDIPALTGAVEAALRSSADDGVLIVDVGGDDAGAIALGRYASIIQSKDYAHFYVVNGCRYLTASAAEAAGLLQDIQSVSRLRATGIINNSNLGKETTPEVILSSLAFAEEAGRETKLPVIATAVRFDLAEKLSIPGLFPVDIYVKSVWD